MKLNLKKMNFFGLPSIDNYLNIFLIMLFSGPFIVYPHSRLCHNLKIENEKSLRECTV